MVAAGCEFRFECREAGAASGVARVWMLQSGSGEFRGVSFARRGFGRREAGAW
jgi:hypothetical protein